MTLREPFHRDPSHWLHRLSPEEWLRAALAELQRAQGAFERHERAAAVAGVKRAAGMALNAALIVRPNALWGRSYVDHLRALAQDVSAPEEVQSAARDLLVQSPSGGSLVSLSTSSGNERLLESARTVMAHAYAQVHGAGVTQPGSPA